MEKWAQSLERCRCSEKVKVIDGIEHRMQRFISNFIPSNAYLTNVSWKEEMLTLLEQGENEEWILDSEDFSSCFNLFRLPSSWRKYMCFAKPVDAKIFGGVPGHMVYPAMGVIPMWWTSAVSVTQMIVRSLVFDESTVPRSSEVRKLERFPIPTT